MLDRQYSQKGSKKASGSYYSAVATVSPSEDLDDGVSNVEKEMDHKEFNSVAVRDMEQINVDAKGCSEKPFSDSIISAQTTKVRVRLGLV